MKNIILEKCEAERKKIQKRREKFKEDKLYQTYADEEEKKIEIKEEIIEILCGSEGMTPRTAEKILNDTKELFVSVAMNQPVKQKND